MATVTTPIMTDATGQSIDSKLNSLLGKMDNLAAAFQPNASGIVYSNTTSGLAGDDVQEAIDEMAADVSEIKQSLVKKTKNVQGSIDASWNGLSVTIDFSGAIGTQAPTGANTDIATLPSEVPKPSTTKYVVASGGANQNKYLVVGIYSDGKIKVFNYTGGVVDYLYGSITYLR